MNTFGQPYQEGTGLTPVQIPLYDPRSVRMDRVRFRRDRIPDLDLANSFYCPVGRWSSRGWIVVRRGDYNLLDKYSTTLQLNIGDPRLPSNTDPLNHLSIVQAQCVTRGLQVETNDIYLVEVTDPRGVVFNDLMQFPLEQSYNIRAQGYPETFLLESMKDYDQPTPSAGSKTTWTWSTMIENIWNKMSARIGTFPGLPFAPIGTPEGFFFQGVPAWTALNDILDHLGMTITCDLTQSTLSDVFNIVKIGATETYNSTLQALYSNLLEDDLEWIDAGGARVPKTITVLFRRRNSVYGTEETVAYRNDIMAEQWNMKDHYAVDITFDDSDGVGKHYIWSDYTIRYDDSSNPLPADVTYAERIAIERARQYLRRMRWIKTTADTFPQTGSRMHQVYSTPLPFITSSQIDGVCWEQDYSQQDWIGWRTKIVRGPCPPFPEIYRDRRGGYGA